MGAYINRMLEAKGKDGKWHAVKLYKSFEDMVSCNADGTVIKENKADISLPNGDKFDISYTYANDTSYLREAFNSTWGECKDYANRGIPEDVSEELKAHIDGFNSEFGVYGWTYVTLEELHNIFSNIKKNYFKELSELFNEKNNGTIQKKLDLLIKMSFLNGNFNGVDKAKISKIAELVGEINLPKSCTDKDEENDIDDRINYYIEERFWEMIAISDEIANVEKLRELFSVNKYGDESGVRIIIFFDC